MSSRRFKKVAVLFIFVCFIYKLVHLYGTYVDLFDIRTFLPKPNLPLQSRNDIKYLREIRQSDEYPKILCLIVTSPKYHQARAVHVAATWAQHCNKAIFVTTKEDENLPHTFIVHEADGYNELWKKTSQAFYWTLEEDLISSFDWVLKTDDDTFVFVENLKDALQSYDPKSLVAVGHKLYTWETNEVYLNGGAGYALSKAAVKHFVSEGLKKKVCETNLALGTNEDVNMAQCLTYLGVSLVDMRDSVGNVAFNIYPPQEQIDPREVYTWKHLWLKSISVHPNPFGFQNITKSPISFHYVSAENMYLVYYLSYIVNHGKDSAHFPGPEK